MSDLAKMGRQGSGNAISVDRSDSYLSGKGVGTTQTSKPQNGSKSKYRARPCIVTPDFTVFTKEDIVTAEALTGDPLTGTGTLAERAARAHICGDWFGSLKEAHRWIELKRLEAAGKVRELRRQVPFSLDVNGTGIGKWIADFVYFESGPNGHGPWQYVREDTKGIRTPVYRRSKAHVQAQYGFTIRET
jgi:hypothetical protein